MKRSKCCLLGIPDDQGVLNVGGRVGAALGPAAFRKILRKMSGKTGLVSQIEDLGEDRKSVV